MRSLVTWLAGGAIALGAVALAVACVDQAMVAENVDSPSVALNWRPNYPDALVKAADDAARTAKSDAQWNTAARLARQAIATSPMQSGALRVLAWDAARAGLNDKADALMNVGGSLTRRDSRISGWLFSSALDRRNWPEAVSRADALMRSEPDLAAPLYPTLISLLKDPAARGALAARLVWRPPWRDDFLAASADSVADPAPVLALFGAVDASRAPITQTERASLIDGLIEHQEFAAARSEWSRTLPASAARASLLYDGDFRGLPGAPPFNWSFVDDRGAISELAAAPGGEPALHLQYPERAAPLLQQLLVLPAGAYRLSGFVQFDHVGPIEELAWRATCVGGTVLAEARLTPVRSGWSSFSMDFVTPATQCPAQQLTLSSLGQENFGVLQAWLRSLSISPTSDQAG